MKKILLFFIISLISSPIFAYNYCNDSDTIVAMPMLSDSDPITDCTGNGNNAAKKSASEPLFSTGSLPTEYPYITGAMLFDGTDDIATITQNSSINLMGQGSWTFAAWVRPETVLAAPAIISKKVDTQWWTFQRTNQVFEGVCDDGTTKLVPQSSNYGADDWYHVAMVKNDGVGITMYVNGTQDGTTGDNNDCDNSLDVVLGFGTDDTYYQGRITQFIFINRVLSQNEIIGLMMGGIENAIVSIEIEGSLTLEGVTLQ